MTGKELIKQIYTLGIDNDCPPTERLFSVITLAMRQLAAKYPQWRSREIVKTAGKELTVCVSDIEDCMRFCEQPIFKDGVPFYGAIASDGTVTLPKDAAGTFTVRYMCAVPEFSAAVYEEKIPVHPCALHLLPLLCAGYFWQEDEPERASLYMEQYKEGVADLCNRQRREFCPEYICRNNW